MSDTDDETELETEETKDLAYYMRHPDEMPTDPEMIEALAASDEEAETETGDEVTLSAQPGTAGKAQEPEPPKEPAKAAGDAVPKPATAPTDPNVEIGDEDADGVHAADGKTIIPYTVLRDTRQSLGLTRDQLQIKERELADAKEQLAAAQAQLAKAPSAGDAKPDVGSGGEVVEIDWDKLSEDYDEEAINVLKALHAKAVYAETQVNDLSGKLEEAQAELNRRKAGEQEQVRHGIQNDIDAVPSMAALQASAFKPDATEADKAQWQAAVELDSALAKSPKWQEAGRVARFREVARIVTGKDTAPAPSGDKPSGDSVDKAVDDALKKAAPSVPTSLSTIPGGSPPPQSELEALDNADVTTVAAKFDGMDPDQIEAYLARNRV